MKNRRLVFVLVLLVVIVAAVFATIDESRREVGQNLGTRSVDYFAYFYSPEGRVDLVGETITVSLVQRDSYVECVASGSDWLRLDSIQEDLEAKKYEVNEKIEELFGGFEVVYLSQSNFWYQGDMAEDTTEGYYCSDQWIIYGFVPVEYFPRQVTEDGFEESVTSILQEIEGKFYVDIDNPQTGAHLGISFNSQRFYDLAEGVLTGKEGVARFATQNLPQVTKSHPISDLRVNEVASFVVPQEDYFSRDIFVQIIESVLPFTVTSDSISFVQSANQSGQETLAQIQGTQDGSLAGLNFGGWGFVSGSLEGSIDGSLESKPIFLIRGSVYVVPNP